MVYTIAHLKEFDKRKMNIKKKKITGY